MLISELFHLNLEMGIFCFRKIWICRMYSTLVNKVYIKKNITPLIFKPILDVEVEILKNYLPKKAVNTVMASFKAMIIV